MSDTKQRPPFIISSKDIPEKTGQYPNSDELLSSGRPIGKLAGLVRIGLHIKRVPPGHRTSYQQGSAPELTNKQSAASPSVSHGSDAYSSKPTRCPYAEQNEEEFVYVLEGACDVWLSSRGRLWAERLRTARRRSMPRFVQPATSSDCESIDGELYPMEKGDLAAFPAGTGISHTFINNSEREVLLLVGGEAEKKDSKIFYPLNPERKAQLIWSNWWDDVPRRSMGPHDGKPNKK